MTQDDLSNEYFSSKRISCLHEKKLYPMAIVFTEV